jgi:hypothetical protein
LAAFSPVYIIIDLKNGCPKFAFEPIAQGLKPKAGSLGCRTDFFMKAF